MRSRWRQFFFRLYVFFRPGHAESDLTREVDAHLGLLADEFQRRGMTPEAARVAARRAFGGVDQAKERSRDERSFRWLEDTRRDLRHALRMLVKTPSFSILVVLMLALGTGGTTAIFAVVNGVLLKPLPFSQAERLVSVRHIMPGIAPDDYPLSRATYLTFRQHSQALDGIALWRAGAVTVTGAGEPQRLRVVQITDDFLPVLGLSPSPGRGYSPEDVSGASESPVILSRSYWVQSFGGAEGVVGRTIRINGRPRPIIGVMPEGVGEVFGEWTPDLYLPLVIDPGRERVGNWSFQALARLRPSVTPAEVGEELSGLTRLATELYPGIPLEELESRGFGTIVRPLQAELVGRSSRVLWIVFATLGLVLFIACANVANLFLVRAEDRQRDVAVRMAMGASRGRLARLFLTESLIVGVLGGATGLLLALGGLRLFLRIAPPGIPRLDGISLEPAVLAFSSTVALLAGLSFGFIPMFRYGGRRPTEPLRESGRGVNPGWRWFSLHVLLAASQVALALVVLIAAGLMIRTFRALDAVPPGFRAPEQVLTFRLSVSRAEAPSGAEAGRVHQQILEALAALPGVTSASAATSVAMDAWDSWDDISVEDFPELDDGTQPFRRLNWITPGYFATLKNRVLAGRELEWADIDARRDVVVVNEIFAREFWDEPARALGKRIRNDTDHPWLEIVGVVENVHTLGLAEEPPAVIYMPFLLSQFWGTRDYAWRDLRYAVRTSRDDPAGLLPEVRRTVRSVNANLPIYDARGLAEILARSLSRISFTLVMLTVAAGVALFLGAIGVYGVISYGVARRTREMGVRMALGACPADLLRMVVRQGGVLAAAGVSVGWLVAAGLSGLMSALLFDVNPVDPLTYGVFAAILVAVILVASYLPARRAAAVDPIAALNSMT